MDRRGFFGWVASVTVVAPAVPMVAFGQPLNASPLESVSGHTQIVAELSAHDPSIFVSKVNGVWTITPSFAG